MSTVQNPLPPLPAKISARKLAANRRNAALSTGPKTPEGKARSAANATSHALTAREIVFRNDLDLDVQAFIEGMRESLKPEGAFEESLVARITAQVYRLRRLNKVEADSYEAAALRGANDLDHDNLALAFEFPHFFLLLHRYEIGIENSMYRNLQALKQLQAERTSSATPGFEVLPDAALARDIDAIAREWDRSHGRALSDPEGRFFITNPIIHAVWENETNLESKEGEESFAEHCGHKNQFSETAPRNLNSKLTAKRMKQKRQPKSSKTQ